MRPTTALDIYQGATKNFHPDGLYSVETFGSYGTPQRDEIFSYININAEIISPMVAFSLFELKRLYKDIMSGTRHAVWDAAEKDFFPAAPGDDGADTGYSFFIKHYKELTPKENKSHNRQDNIDLLNLYRDISLSQYVLVLPAGLRDIEITDGGLDKEDDLNKLYKRLLSTSRMVPDVSNKNHKSLDTTRWLLQKCFNDIFKYIFDIEDGKKGFERGKWTQRNITNGTRNVLSSMDASSLVMGVSGAIRPTDIVVGMVQGLRALLPVAIHAVRTKFSESIDAGNGYLYLIDKKTFKREREMVSAKEYDAIISDEGIESLIINYRYMEDPHHPVIIADKYVALVYSKGDKFKILYDIDELPKGFERKYVKPISYIELLYLSGYDKWNKYFMFFTRYPVAGNGSTYPSSIRLETTVKSSIKYELDDSWVTYNQNPAASYPDSEINEFVNSMAPNPTRVSQAQADFDGDTGSGDAVYTDESIQEIKEKIDSPSYWTTINGKMSIDIETDIIVLTLHNLLGDPL